MENKTRPFGAVATIALAMITTNTSVSNALGFEELGSASNLRNKLLSNNDIYLNHHEEKDNTDEKDNHDKEEHKPDESDDEHDKDEHDEDKSGSEMKCGEGSCGS